MDRPNNAFRIIIIDQLKTMFRLVSSGFYSSSFVVSCTFLVAHLKLYNRNKMKY